MDGVRLAGGNVDGETFVGGVRDPDASFNEVDWLELRRGGSGDNDGGVG